MWGTSKYQQPSLQYQVLQDHKRQLRKNRREAGLHGDTNEALATGTFVIALLLQGFDIGFEEDFARLHPSHRENATIYSTLHVGCVRFGLLNFTDPKREDVCHSNVEASFLFSGIWRKIFKSKRPFTFRIPCSPDSEFPGMYKVKLNRGRVNISTDTIFGWYLKHTNLLDAHGSAILFPILAAQTDRRRYFVFRQMTTIRILMCVTPRLYHPKQNTPP